jgi:hypothetical protein
MHKRNNERPRDQARFSVIHIACSVGQFNLITMQIKVVGTHACVGWTLAMTIVHGLVSCSGYQGNTNYLQAFQYVRGRSVGRFVHVLYAGARGSRPPPTCLVCPRKCQAQAGSHGHQWHECSTHHVGPRNKISLQYVPLGDHPHNIVQLFHVVSRVKYVVTPACPACPYREK